MKTRIKVMLGILLLVGILAIGCATEGTTTSKVSRDPFHSPTWWGMDPVCSPGCPPAMSPGW